MRSALSLDRTIYWLRTATVCSAALCVTSLLTICVGAANEQPPSPSPAHPSLAVFYVILIVLFPTILLGIDVVSTHRHTRRAQDALVDNAKLSPDELKLILPLIGKTPTGMSGLSRTTMSVTVILIIGVALIHLLVFGGGDAQVVERTLTTLVGVVATMMGFYFGGRTAQQQAQSNALTLATPSTAQLSSIQPPTSKAGGPVAAMGKGFGTTHGEVRVGAQPATVVDWNDSVVIFTVPAIPAGAYDVTILLPAGGAQLKSAAGALTVTS